MEHNVFSDITPDIVRLADLSRQAGIIEQELFTKYEVKRGLRDLNGKGVLAGLTTISDVRANKIVNGEQVPTHGELFYRGYNVKDLVKGFTADGRFGFEEVAYLLLFDALPDAEELSGIGAAYMAGISAGVYDLEKLAGNMNRSVYEPKMDDEIREKKYAGWKKAVDGVLSK